MTTAFQQDAFQNDAFQTESGVTEDISPTGSITPASALVELVSVHKTGAITPTGALSRLLSRFFSGAITPAGVLRRTTQIFKGGSIAPSGTLDNLSVRTISPTGEVVPAGSVDRLPKVRKAGSISPSGQLTRAIFRGSASTTTVGSIAPSGTLFVRVIRGGEVVTAPGSGIIPRVLIEGVGDVSSEVVYAQTELTISAGPDANESRMVLRNIGGLTAQYITGKRVTVDLEGEVIWAGYLQRASRQFWFEADHPEHLNRRWVLSLIDLNALFTKRVMYKRSRPKQVSGPVYTAPTYDKAIIEDLLAGWIDLSADDLDLTTLVDQVAIVNPSSDVCIPEAQNFYPWDGGFQWGEAMVTIAQVPATIFGLLPAQPLGSSPFGRLFYCDVDSENAPFELSDLPGAGQHGYREMTIWETGTELVNESFAWGAGKGVDHMVFHHRTASGSIDNHLLWQQGDLLFNIWCQDTIEKVTDSLINGSPTSRRGHKNPVDSVELVVREDGLRVGQKVRFINNGYGYDEVLPIRKSVISFPAPDTRSYKLLLSEALDRWGFQDPPLPFRGMRGEEPTIIDVGVVECDLFDRFERTVSESLGWATSDFGLPYSYSGIEPDFPSHNRNAASVADFGEGSVGKLRWDSGSPQIYLGPLGASGGMDFGPWTEPQWTFTMQFKTGDWPYGGGGPHDGYANIELKTNARSVILQTGVNIGFAHPHGQVSLDSVSTDFDWHPNQWYSVTWFYDAPSGTSKLKVWETFFEPEPAGWTLEESLGAGDDPVVWMRVGGVIKNSSWDETSPYVAYFNDFDFAYDGRYCHRVVTIIDDYERLETGQWGTPSRGTPDWVNYSDTASDTSTSAASVSSGFGRIILNLNKPASAARGAFRTMQLEIPEIIDWNEFVLEFEMVVAPAVTKTGIAEASILIGGTGGNPTDDTDSIHLNFQFEHPTLFGVPSGNHLDWDLSRDALGGVEHVRNDTIANVSSFQGTIRIDRSVSRGSTLVTVGGLGTFEFSPISPKNEFAGIEDYLYVSYGDVTGEACSNVASTFSIDNIRLVTETGST